MVKYSVSEQGINSLNTRTCSMIPRLMSIEELPIIQMFVKTYYVGT